MHSMIAVCNTLLFFATVPAQAAPEQNAAPAHPAPRSESTQSPVKQPAPPAKAAEPVKKSEPQARVAFRPEIDPAKTQAQPQAQVKQPQPVANAAPKLELLPIEQNIIDGTNAERARFGLPAYIVDANLMATARQHCSWMATYRQMVHTNIGVAENIAMGQPTSQDVVRTWMNSSGHRANILNGGNRRIGVAAYRTPEGTIYWCQQFTP
jgi:uncharacterized protein YkwD